MKLINGFWGLLNHFTVVVVTLKKEADPDILFYEGYWKKKKMCLEAVDTMQSGKWPILILFTGYGVIIKNCDSEIDWAGRVTTGDEFLWEWKTMGEERSLVFVRRDVVIPWLEKWEKEGWAMAGVSLSVEVSIQILEVWIEKVYRHWQTWKYWRKDRKEQQVLATLLLKRLKWPILLLALFLSAIGYPLQTALQRQVLQQQEELSLWQQKMQLYRDDEERIGRISRMLIGNGRLAPLFDRIAAAVPLGVTLVRLDANPLERRVEAGKPLVVKERCVVVEGYTRKPEEVVLFTESLSEIDRSWRVMLEGLDRRKDKKDFTFRISIVWQTDKERNYEAK